MPSDTAAHEYAALRQAIAQRGQLKATVALVGLLGWAALWMAGFVLLRDARGTAVTLAVLWAAFEIIRPLHIGAERLGRYLQVFHETPGQVPAWEHTAMALGAAVPGAAGHPLYMPVFVGATLLNATALWVDGPLTFEGALMLGPHLALLWWLWRADRAMRVQRTNDLARLEALRHPPAAMGDQR
ncbi:MAG: hypothetical protein FJW29_03580 [Acidobacteria bacterium]|nr:hypothetical protein [Acidobacteriota bacterium]